MITKEKHAYKVLFLRDHENELAKSKLDHT